MITFLETAPDVLAVEVSSRIEEKDLDAILDRLEPMLDAHEKVHVFVESRTIDGVDLPGLGRYAARAMPLFAKLKRFGRVAVVADQGWIRAATRIESAILPFLSYNTFLPEDRDIALEWVCGRRSSAERG